MSSIEFPRAVGPAPASGFTWPSLYSFPPFFTPQPHVETAIAQLDAWTNLILSYSRENRAFYVDLIEAPPAEVERSQGCLTLGSDLFYNQTINRRVNPTFARTIAHHLVQSGRAAWDDGRGPLPASKKARDDATRFWILWRRPEEWAEIIYNWVRCLDPTSVRSHSLLTLLTLFSYSQVKETGQNKSIMTLFELTEGPTVQNTGSSDLSSSCYCVSEESLTRTPRPFATQNTATCLFHYCVQHSVS